MCCFNRPSLELAYFCSETFLEATFWTTLQNRKPQSVLIRAGHFRYFWIFSKINDFLAFSFKLIDNFCTNPIKKPTPSQIKLIKIAKNNFLLLQTFKNTESAQLWTPDDSLPRTLWSNLTCDELPTCVVTEPGQNYVLYVFAILFQARPAKKESIFDFIVAELGTFGIFAIFQ